MTIIPSKAVHFAARSDADFKQEFLLWDDAAQTEPMDLDGWTFRFAVKRDELDEADLFAAEGEDITVADNSVIAFIERETLADAMGDDEKRIEAVYALQATGPDDLDAVFAAGKFVLTRGL